MYSNPGGTDVYLMKHQKFVLKRLTYDKLLNVSIIYIGVIVGVVREDSFVLKFNGIMAVFYENNNVIL